MAERRLGGDPGPAQGGFGWIDEQVALEVAVVEDDGDGFAELNDAGIVGGGFDGAGEDE